MGHTEEDEPGGQHLGVDMVQEHHPSDLVKDYRPYQMKGSETRLGPTVTALDNRRDVHEMAAGARPTPRELVVEVRDVVHDLPVLLTAPLYRNWHLHWGATPSEIDATLPGDDLLPRAQFRATRAITIEAPPRAFWPWLVQVGCLQAGWYSNDLLDNLAHPSATTIEPRLQHLETGQWVPMSPTPSDATALKVHSFELDEWLLWTKSDSTWAWQLTPTDTNGTRLVTRIHAVYDWQHPMTVLLGVLLMEFGDFAMLRRMLRGIKERAESLDSQTRSDTEPGTAGLCSKSETRTEVVRRR